MGVMTRIAAFYKRRTTKAQKTLKSPKTPKLNFYECSRYDNSTPPDREEDLYRAKVEYEIEIKQKRIAYWARRDKQKKEDLKSQMDQI